MARRVKGVAVIEGTQTGDSRVISAGAVTWAPLPLPFGWLQREQHGDLLDGAVQIGTLDTLTRVGSNIEFTGTIDDEQPDGAEMVRRLEAGTAPLGSRWGVSIDPDNWNMELLLAPGSEDDETVMASVAGRGSLPAHVTAAAGDPDPEPGTMELLFSDNVDDLIARYTALRVRGLTACAIAAFDGAWMELDGAAGAEDAPAEEAEDEAVVAAAVAIVSRPSAEWFATAEPQPGDTGMRDVYGMDVSELLVPQPDGGLGVPWTVLDDGRCFGHAARWGQCHVGYATCVTAPESLASYAHFHHGEVVCDDGSRVATGTLTMGCDHAAAELRAPEARDHYANSGLAFADVRAINGTLGVWVAGALRPDVTEDQLRILRASSLSGDWRRIGSGLEFIGALAVNVPGFPIARESMSAAGLINMPAASLAASAWTEDGVQQSLVAAGVVHRCPECQQRLLAARGAGADPDSAEMRRLLMDMAGQLGAIEVRTRHLMPAASAAALARIRRG